jgi:hypothetical protein
MALHQSAWDDYAADRIVDHFFRNIPFSPSSSLFLALGTNAANSPLAGEPVGNNYSRLEINGATGLSFSAPVLNDTLGKIANEQVWFFPRATGGNWGTMQSLSIMDASSGGNRVGMCDIDGAGQAINDGEQYEIRIGDIFFQNQVPDVSSALSNFCLTGAGHALFCNLIFRGDSSAPPDTNVWIGLLTNDGDTQAGREEPYSNDHTENSTGGYARIEIGEDTPATGIGITAVLSPGGGHGFEIDVGDLDFPLATADYAANVWFMGFFEQETTGNLLGFGPLRDGGNAAGFVTAPGIPVGKNSFVRVDDGDGQYQVTIS